MPHPHPRKSVTGKITHVFGHRFVVKADEADILADVTPKGLEQVTLKVGQKVTLEGEMKPSELKVDRFTLDGRTFAIHHKKKHEHHHHPHHHHDHHHHHHHHHHEDADPAIALKSARAAGYKPLAEPRRKPKHFEVLGSKDGSFGELHIELDGHIRKVKAVDRSDHKWAGFLG